MKFVALLPEPDAHILLVVHVVSKVILLEGDTPSNFHSPVKNVMSLSDCRRGA